MNYQNDLVIKNIKLIFYVLKKLNLYNRLGIEKYYDVGVIGLVRGAKTYNKTLGISESTYLFRCIFNEISNELQKEKREKRNQDTISLSTEIYKNLTLEDLIASNVNIEKKIELDYEVENLKQAISNLSNTEQFVIVHSYGLFNNDKLAQKEIAKKIGLSPKTIGTMKVRIITKLGKILKGKL